MATGMYIFLGMLALGLVFALLVYFSVPDFSSPKEETEEDDSPNELELSYSKDGSSIITRMFKDGKVNLILRKDGKDITCSNVGTWKNLYHDTIEVTTQDGVVQKEKLSNILSTIPSSFYKSKTTGPFTIPDGYACKQLDFKEGERISKFEGRNDDKITERFFRDGKTVQLTKYGEETTCKQGQWTISNGKVFVTYDDGSSYNGSLEEALFGMEISSSKFTIPDGYTCSKTTST